jgi:hypothetical protein
VREVSRGWTWKRLETPGWKLLMADHVVVRGDVPVADLRAAAAYLEEFHAVLRETIGGDVSDLMFSARVFSDPRDFHLYASVAGAANAESLYDPRSAELALCLDRSRGRGGLARTLAHEFTHEYMDRVWKRTAPLWFAEGMAEYFANFEVREGRVRPGALDEEALLRLREAGTPSLRRLLRLGREEFYGPDFPILYAQAWAFVHYLFARRDGLIDLLLRGSPLEGIDALEEGWREYLGTLE